MVLACLRAHEVELRERNIVGLWVFGSVARGEAGPDSRIDLIAALAPEAKSLLRNEGEWI
ncbi:nucleotidyltransferase family protein [Belnapia mucosa]